jgi:hypothetical protein
VADRHAFKPELRANRGEFRVRFDYHGPL